MKLPKKSIAAIAMLIVAGAISAIPLFIYPAQHRPTHADAIVVLAGAANERFPVAKELFDDGVAPVLVASDPGTADNVSTVKACQGAPPSLICFNPDEDSTRGEARAVARLAKTHGWRSIVVVTSSYHLKRATTLIDQTTGLTVYGVASRPRDDLLAWGWHIVHETGGLLDAWIRPEQRI